MTYNTRAVIIKYQKYKEFDRIYTVYTEDFGKLILLARGSNKIKSKLAGHLEPGILSYLMIAQGRQFDVLAQARTLKSFVAVRQNPVKLETAAVLLESLDKLTESLEEDKEVFDLLVKALQSLKTVKLPSNTAGRQVTLQLQDLIYHYLLHLLIHLGHAPDLKHEKKLEDLLLADISGDGIIVNEEARMLINQYLRRALDEKKLYSFVF